MPTDRYQEVIGLLDFKVDALARINRALRQYHLMQHIIKWKAQAERRSPSWVATIREARQQVRVG